MKLAQYYDGDMIRLGTVMGDDLFPLDFQGDLIDFILNPVEPKNGGQRLSLKDIRFAPAVTRPSKIIGIGLNYLDHIRESKGEPPERPLIFAKFPSSLAGHKDPIHWDTALTNKVDFEAELAVIMGRTINNCTKEEAAHAVFGYTCANDVSARDLQFGDGQWVRGKTLDSFCPLGPWVVTADEIPDPHSLKIRSILNGTVMQDSNTDLMLFKVPELVSFLARNFTLVPGDVILTGTPHGVGTFQDPSIYMKDGDEIVIEIQGIGKLENICRTAGV